MHLLGIVASRGDTLSEAEVLDMLREWNRDGLRGIEWLARRHWPGAVH